METTRILYLPTATNRLKLRPTLRRDGCFSRLTCSRVCFGTEPRDVLSILLRLLWSTEFRTTLSPNRSSITPSFNRCRPKPNTTANMRSGPGALDFASSTPLALELCNGIAAASSRPKKSVSQLGGWGCEGSKYSVPTSLICFQLSIDASRLFVPRGHKVEGSLGVSLQISLSRPFLFARLAVGLRCGLFDLP